MGWYLGTADPNKGVIFRWSNESGGVKMEKCFASTQYPTERYRPRFEVSYLDGPTVSNGVYFLKNVASGSYVDVENQAIQDGATIHQWQFCGSPTSQWYFEWQSAGYYTIRSCKNQNYYLGVSGDSSVEHAIVVLRTGTVTDGMKWKVLEESTGVYKLVSFAGEANNRVLAVQTSNTNQAADGLKILSSTYSSNDYNNDLWILEAFGTPQCRFLAYHEAGIIERDDYFSPCATMVSAFGMEVYANHYISISKPDIKRQMFDSDLFVVHTHGDKTGIQLDRDNTLLSMDDLGTMYLGNLTLAILLTCNAGEGGYSEANIAANTPTNLVEKMACNGAKAVVGFSAATDVASCNSYIAIVIKNLLDGSSVDFATYLVDEREVCSYLVDLRVIGGNPQLNWLEEVSS